MHGFCCVNAEKDVIAGGIGILLPVSAAQNVIQELTSEVSITSSNPSWSSASHEGASPLL